MNRWTFNKFQTDNWWLVQVSALRRACAKLHQERPFDILQYASYSATGLLRLKNVPAIVRISSYEPMLQQASAAPASLEHRILGWMEKTAIRRADALFGSSKLVCGVVGKDVGLPVEVIEPPFTVDSSGWDDQPYLDHLDGQKYLLFLGTLGVLKGVPTIAEILKPLLREEPELRFVFIGKETIYNGEPITNYVYMKAGEFADRVLYLGQMRHRQLYPVLSHAAAVVLPSRIDNLPNACIEAMALGRIVIGSRGASFDQLIVDGISGFLCEIDSPQSLYDSIRKALVLSEEDQKSMGELAAQRISELRPEKAVARLIDFYQSVIEQ
jgi:glycosyltransferase involved in cell wall biosynthesis